MENKDNNVFRQTNAFAMLYGLWLGLWGFLSLVFMVAAMVHPFLSFVNVLMFYGSPFFAAYLTVRFRRNVMVPESGFTFGRGFLFTFMMGIYASIWIAVGVYAYLAWFDHGYVFEVYEQVLSQPENAAQLTQGGMLDVLTQGKGISGMVDAMRAISPGNYAGMVIYLTFFSAPFFSALIALACRRAPKIFS